MLARAGVTSLEAADQADLLEVLSHRQQRKLSPRSTARWLSTLKGFYRYAVLQQRIDIDPTQQIEHPKLGRILPGALSMTEVEALLAAPDVESPLGLRDRAMLELLYASGLRITELVTLEIANVNQRQGVVRVWARAGRNV